MQQTFNAKAQRCEGAKFFQGFAGKLNSHPLVSEHFGSPPVFPLCGLAALRLGVEFQLNRSGLYRPAEHLVDLWKVEPDEQTGTGNLWVLMDEHPDSINDASLAVICGYTGAASVIVDYPASYHNGACGIAFGDGHSEIHKWLDDRTKPRVTGVPLPLGVPSPNNNDFAWLQARTSAKP